MSVEAHAVVFCNAKDCRERIEVTLTETVTGSGNSWDDRNVNDELFEEGWSVSGDEHFCPEHTDSDEEGQDTDEDEDE